MRINSSVEDDRVSIPAQMQPVYEEIAGMIDEYCGKYLNEEYRALCLRLLAGATLDYAQEGASA